MARQQDRHLPLLADAFEVLPEIQSRSRVETRRRLVASCLELVEISDPELELPLGVGGSEGEPGAIGRDDDRARTVWSRAKAQSLRWGNLGANDLGLDARLVEGSPAKHEGQESHGDCRAEQQSLAPYSPALAAFARLDFPRGHCLSGLLDLDSCVGDVV